MFHVKQFNILEGNFIILEGIYWSHVEVNAISNVIQVVSKNGYEGTNFSFFWWFRQ